MDARLRGLDDERALDRLIVQVRARALNFVQLAETVQAVLLFVFAHRIGVAVYTGAPREQRRTLPTNRDLVSAEQCRFALGDFNFLPL